MRWLLIFTILFCNPVFAATCNELKESLAAIEYQIQTKPSSCNKKPCPNKQKLEQEYNAALGDLVIAKGLQTIGMAIDSSHNGLIHMREEDVKKAKEKFDLLDDSLTKADLIYRATEVKNVGTFFRDFNELDQSEESKTKLAQYSFDRCKNDSNYNSTSLCSLIKEIEQNNDQKFVSEMMTSLHSFLNADEMAHNGHGDRQREKSFETYRSKLKIKLGDEVMTPSKYKENDNFNKIKELQELTEKFMQAKKDGAPTSDLGDRITALSNEIEEVSVSYNHDPQTGTLAEGMEKHFNEKFYKPLQSLDLPSLLITSPFKSDFENSKKRVEVAYNRHEALARNNLNEFINKNPGKLPLNKCSGDVVECVESLCGEIKEGSTCNKWNEINFDIVYRDIKELAKEKVSFNALDKANNCLNKKDLDTKKECLAEVAKIRNLNGTQTEISRLEDKANKLRAELNNFENKSEFDDLNIQKLLALNALTHQGCFPKDIELIQDDNPLKLTCGVDTTEIDKTTLTLTGDMGDIMYQMDKDVLQQLLKDKDTHANIDKYKEEIETQCAAGASGYLLTLCHFYANKNQVREEVAKAEKKRQKEIARQEKKRRESYIDFEEEENEIWGAGQIGKAIFGTTLQLTPLWGQAFSQMAQTRSQTALMKYQINAQKNAQLAAIANARLRLTIQQNSTYSSLSSFGLTGAVYS